MKSIISKIIGPKILGAIDYYRHPDRRQSWGGPFNGQLRRQEIFVGIVERLKFAAVIETGTYLGTTTEFMADTGLPVFTVEGNPRSYGFAKTRLRSRPNVTLRLGDSRAELASFLQGPLRNAVKNPILIYLDAHWNADLPLAEELDIVFRHCSQAIVIIDDFQVPDDPGYGYDDYGPKNALNAEYIAPAIARYALKAFYPRAQSDQETGARRGCVVLAQSTGAAATLTVHPLLRAIQTKIKREPPVKI